MGDSSCYQLAKDIQGRVASLYSMQTRLLELKNNPFKGRVYYKKLKDRTHDFKNNLPYYSRITCFSPSNPSGHLYRMNANDKMMKILCGDEAPYVDITGELEGWDLFFSLTIKSWMEFWSMRFNSDKTDIYAELGK